MSCFAQYRLPFAQNYTRIEQTGGEIAQLSSCTQLNATRGFVVAPFQIGPDHPILLIRPDRISTLPLPKSTPQPSTLNSQLSTLNPQPSTLNPQLSTLNPQLSTLNPQPSTLNPQFQDYAVDFANYHAQLQAGMFRKIVLARSTTVHLSAPASARQLFLEACRRYPRLFVALVSLPDGNCWLTATPEILLEGVGRQWRTVALAGTMQLQGDELEGEGETVRWSTKNIQEQRYVATYIAECLKRFTLNFNEEGPRTVRAAHLVHLRSDFTFYLPDGSRVGDLLQALHPTPAVCGLPKDETLRFIIKNEHSPRQYYSGFMGPMALDDETHLYVSLRCMRLAATQCQLFAGGGLLKDSLLEQEWQETEAKMQTMRALLHDNELNNCNSVLE